MTSPYFAATCGVHARTARGFLSDDFTATDRKDLREFLITWLAGHGVTVDHFITLPQIAALLEVLAGERAAEAA